MPIVDVQLITDSRGAAECHAFTQLLADALGKVFASDPGRTWLRVHALPQEHYAENNADLNAEARPVFVTVLHARPPTGHALATEALAVTRAVAACVGCDVLRVHVQYAPAGAGRQAFGGRLVE